ncbi:alanine/glycine:cation symporter family protein [Fusobacterium hominis]|uniref:Alanine:cation symporter family protein n=1 Tax=Fusobacterium hominis TaxID=2764326 RepID=A0A7G9GXU8_9FUSO|nr:alanine/glycine:cation symporter family protein [Fusobacterium hominis]QNM15630.1 alanine:cation symporter family protein [Fusobacterium hominis]
MNLFETTVNFFNNIMWNHNLLVVILIVCGLIFTIKTRGVQFRLFKHMCKLLFEKSTAGKDEVSSFQAFCISTASRVGVGNLAGVVAAVSYGGPGSVFWMWVVALLSSATAYIESTIAIIYRDKDPKGGYRGGAAYFIKNGLNLPILSVLFVIFALICWAGVFQIISNSVTESFHTAFDINKQITSIILVVLSGFILFGNRNKIVRVLDKLVPVMAGLYLLVVFFIIIKNINLLGATIVDIFEHAFGVKQFLGGTFGSVIMFGVKRGLFSNEAGSGSAPCAAAAAEVEHPSKQGLIQALGVLVDTIVICSATAFVILLSKNNIPAGLTDMPLLQEAFRSQVGDWGVIFTALILFLFSFSTILGISFYARPNLYFLSNKEWPQEAFKLFTLVMLYLGGVGHNSLVWSLADLGLGLMTIVNLIGVFPLVPKAIESLNDYENKFINKKGL